MVQRETKLVKLYEILLESSIRNLRLFESSFLTQIQKIQNCDNISVPEVYHFFPEPCGHFFTRIYFKNDEEDLLRKHHVICRYLLTYNIFIGLGYDRELLHHQLILPLNQPLFRRANKFIFKEDIQGTNPLINPHDGLHSTGNG